MDGHTYTHTHTHKHIYTQTYIYIYIYNVKLITLATFVEDDPKAPFSIATTPRCRGQRYLIPWIASLYPLIFTWVWLDLGLNHGLPDQWRTLYSLRYIYIHIYIKENKRHLHGITVIAQKKHAKETISRLHVPDVSFRCNARENSINPSFLLTPIDK